MAADPRPPLTDRQLALLRWIADGCPDGVWPDHSHKNQMRGLELRGFAATQRWYGKWGAVVLPAGRYYLEHGREPDVDRPAPVLTGAPAVNAPPKRESKPKSAEAMATKPPSPRPVKINASQQLIRDIMEAGGTLRVEFDPQDSKAANSLTTKLRIAERRGYLPEAKELTRTWVSRGVVDLALVDPPAWKTAALPTVRVRRSLDNLDAVLQRLRDDDKLLRIAAAASRRRALRLLQALVTAMQSRDFKVALVSQHERPDRWTRELPGQLRFTSGRHEVQLSISSVLVRVEHKPTASELRWQREYGSSYPKWDHVPSTRLQISMPGRFVHHGSSWADSDDSTLEALLPEIAHEFELRVRAAEEDRLIQEEKRRQARAAHDRLIAQATQRFHESKCVAELDRQAEAWRRSALRRDYLAAAAAHVAVAPDDDARDAALRWLEWAKGYAEASDPLKGLPRAPVEREPAYGELQEFMPKGVSVYASI